MSAHTEYSPTPANPPAPGRGIIVEHARRSFGPVLAVDDISLVAHPGEITALIGPNGSGKTTLMLMLASLLVPDAGSIRIDGHDPVADPAAVRARIGWMPDGFGTWDALTVREILSLVASAYHVPTAEAADRITRLLRLVHLDDLADRPARVLSRGQKQRLGLARALINEPSVLILDEPASGLDPRSRIELRDILRSLAAQGCTVLVSSHILTELQEIADRSVIVARGRTIDAQDIDRTPTSMTYRIGATDRDALTRALASFGLSPVRAGTAVEVEVRDESAAIELLRELVGAHIPITSYAPAQGSLEAAYLATTKDRA